jgi:hypothetical protein
LTGKLEFPIFIIVERKTKGYKMDLLIERDEDEVTEETPVMVAGVESDGVYDGVTVINICKLIDVIMPDYWGTTNYTYADECKIVTAWCEANDAAYYADVREDFWVGHGVYRAKKDGKTVVVVEDLS